MKEILVKSEDDHVIYLPDDPVPAHPGLHGEIPYSELSCLSRVFRIVSPEMHCVSRSHPRSHDDALILEPSHVQEVMAYSHPVSELQVAERSAFQQSYYLLFFLTVT